MAKITALYYTLTIIVRSEWVHPMRHWQIREAKARLSEVIKQAEHEGPQEITLHGKPVAVILSHKQYEKLIDTDESLVDFMRRSPLYGDEELILERDQSL